MMCFFEILGLKRRMKKRVAPNAGFKQTPQNPLFKVFNKTTSF
jgi:hypothetical protein